MRALNIIFISGFLSCTAWQVQAEPQNNLRQLLAEQQQQLQQELAASIRSQVQFAVKTTTQELVYVSHLSQQPAQSTTLAALITLNTADLDKDVK